MSQQLFTYTGDPNEQDPKLFSESITGTCLCGSIAVTISGNIFDAPNGHLCHCSNCRKVAGSMVSSNLMIEEERVNVVDQHNMLREYIDQQTGSGTPLSRFFCGTCGK